MSTVRSFLGAVISLIPLSLAAVASEFDPRPTAIENATAPAGTVIDSANVDQFSALLPPALGGLVTAGRAQITVGEFITIPVHPNYVSATEQYGGQAALGEAVGDLLSGRCVG